MKRLTPYARGLLVALAALAIMAGAAVAARGQTPVSQPAGQHGSAATGQAGQNAQADSEAPDADGDTEVGDKAETPEAETPVETPDTATPDSNAGAARAQNHGWFVSEAAKAVTPAGFDNHGAYVSSIAHGTDGKPDAAAKGAAKSAAGKAKGAAAKATHPGH